MRQFGAPERDSRISQPDILRVMSSSPGACPDPAELTLAAASKAVRARAISPRELTEACLARIGRLNPALNAFITVTAAEALAQARELEAELARGEWRGPLHGVPIALKDLVDTAGIRTTAASAVFADRVPLVDAEVVRRLREQGAIFLGKLNLHEFAYGGTSDVTHFGPVRNPWNLAYSPGGSSGGSAVAVAARMCFGAVGTDTAASIRTPASCCGIAGMKPTYGRVSTCGVIPLSWSLDHVGPMCRTVEDTALMLEAMAGFDPADPGSIDAPVPRYSESLRESATSLRIGLPRKMYWENLDPEVERAAREALRIVEGLGAGMTEMQLPSVDNLTIADAEAYAFHEPFLAARAHLYSVPIRERLLAGGKVSTSAYIRAKREMERWRREIAGVFADVDLIVTPTLPVKPVKVGTPSDLSLIRNTNAFDVFGLPTISIPCGFSSEGLPIGLQITGPRLEESSVFRLAHAYEQAAGFFTRGPELR
jgi:aspartyl-tRNA(Asn)/glutamyl-tRNA(Gln) amidotransferase subunit A